ncbi:lipocalin family protein [Bacteroides acidifaciens]|mgnify:CR=1 FL=1|uniref:lipocalin family protein n=1 Tax=Bacteroides acidifaciens TaxID=85831 RepID=UPI002432C0AF|nr:lipocalin family protein [Bacteroides acidifaciens]
MRKKILVATLLVGLLAACGGSATSVVGTWVEPVPGMAGQVQGIKMEEGGGASSVNMATLIYESWKQEGDKLILTGKSIGNGQTIEFTDTMAIKKLTADSLVLDNRGMEIRYTKQK